MYHGWDSSVFILMHNSGNFSLSWDYGIGGNQHPVVSDLSVVDTLSTLPHEALSVASRVRRLTVSKYLIQILIF